MNHNDKIYVAGHTGLTGSAIVRYLEGSGFTNLVTRSHKDLDLINQAHVQKFFEKEKPDYVILAAAAVGGIYANNTYPADFIYKNTMIEFNVIHSAFLHGVKRLLFLGSTCIYPREAKQPMQENALLSGFLEPTNEPYAVAKIAGIKLCESYNRQHGTDFRSVMPTNLYGINDTFHSENSHIIPALIDRFHKAKTNNEREVTVWGSGSAMREFLYVDDMAEASLFVFELSEDIYKKYTEPMLSHINIGTGKDISIKEAAEIIKEVVGYQGKLSFDPTMPDGSPRKLIDVTLLSNLGWRHSTSLKDGLKQTYKWYLSNIIESSM